MSPLLFFLTSSQCGCPLITGAFVTDGAILHLLVCVPRRSATSRKRPGRAEIFQARVPGRGALGHDTITPPLTRVEVTVGPAGRKQEFTLQYAGIVPRKNKPSYRLGMSNRSSHGNVRRIRDAPIFPISAISARGCLCPPEELVHVLEGAPLCLGIEEVYDLGRVVSEWHCEGEGQRVNRSFEAGVTGTHRDAGEVYRHEDEVDVTPQHVDAHGPDLRNHDGSD